MRYISVLLVLLVTFGCGSGTNNAATDPLHNPGVGLTPPAITSLSPSTVPVNSVPFTLLVNGDNFGADATVFWNGTPLTTLSVTGSAIMAPLNDQNLMFAGSIPVYVRSGGMNSNTVVFNVAIQ
jgi:hypothetical protein